MVKHELFGCITDGLDCPGKGAEYVPEEGGCVWTLPDGRTTTIPPTGSVIGYEVTNLPCFTILHNHSLLHHFM
jgi:hypothetical protein